MCLANDLGFTAPSAGISAHTMTKRRLNCSSILPQLFNSMAQSLLLMTTVAMPVFSKKKETLSHGILLGVVGTDIPLVEVMLLAPRYKVQ